MRRIIRDDSGATAVEYGILLAMISLVVFAGLSQAHAAISTLFVNISSALART